MNRVLTELTPECEVTARLYAQGYEKKEIAQVKNRAVSTINNQLQQSFDVLKVRNGRELATLIYQRVTGIHLTMSFDNRTRTLVAFCLLGVFMFSFLDGTQFVRRSRRAEFRTEIRIRGREIL